MTAAFFHRALLLGGVFIQRDIQTVYYPLHQFWAEQVRRGHFPGWYPYDGLGQPYVAMLVGSAFHPMHLLDLVLPLGAAMTAKLLLCYAAAAWGMVQLLSAFGCSRRAAWAGALAYAFCGEAVSLSNNLLYLAAAATVPWVLWAAHRTFERPSAGRLFLSAALLASVLFAGDPQAFAVTCAGVFVLALLEAASLRRARLGVAAAVVLLGGLLGAVQEVPTLAVVKVAAAADNSPEVALRWSGQPLRLVEMALGPLWLNAAGDELLSTDVARALDPWEAAWVNSQHLGMVVLLLAAAGLLGYRRRRAARGLAVVTAVLVLLWLGRHGGLYGLLHHLPVWKNFRYPEKLSPFLVLPLALAAAFGLDRAARDAAFARRVGRAALLLAVAVLGLALLELRGHVFSSGLLGRAWPQVPGPQRLVLGGNFVRACAASAAALLVAGVGLSRGRAGLLLVVAAVVGNLYWAQRHLYWLTPPDVLHEPSSFLQQMVEEGSPPAPGRFRVVSYAPNAPLELKPEELSMPDYVSRSEALALKSAIPGMFGLESRNSYLPAANRRVNARVRPWADSGLFNTRYLVLVPEAARRRAQPGDLVAQAQGLGLTLVRAPGYLPRAYLAAPRCVPDLAAAVALIDGGDFKPGREAAVECGAWQPPGTPVAEGGAAVLERFEPDRVELSTSSATGALLVLNDAYYPGWTATVDGRDAPILPTNAMVRGVWVPAGRHRVAFVFRAPGLALGLAVSAAALLVMLVLSSVEAARRASPRFPQACR